MAEFLRENGRMTKDMVEVMKDILMEIFIKVNSNMGKPMVRVDINGFHQEKCTMASGPKA